MSLSYRRARIAGFSMVEVVLAIGVCVFCLATLMGLMVLGLRYEKDSSDQVRAANILSVYLAERRSYPSLTGTSIADNPFPQLTDTNGVILTNTNAAPVYLDSAGTVLANYTGAVYRLQYAIEPDPVESGTGASASGTSGDLTTVQVQLLSPAIPPSVSNTNAYNEAEERYEVMTYVRVP